MTGQKHSTDFYRGDNGISNIAKVAATAALLSLFLSGCGTIFSAVPDLPDRNSSYWETTCNGNAVRDVDTKNYINSKTNFDTAIDYAYCTQRNYIDWMEKKENLSIGMGLAEIGLAGAAVGLGGVGGSKEAITALTTAATATLAADQFVIGSPSKDARYKAVVTGIGQLQCVIDDAEHSVPNMPGAGDDDQKTLMTLAVNHVEKDLKSPLSDADAALSDAIDGGVCKSDADTARLLIARAKAAEHRADKVTQNLNGLPGNIVLAVHSIHQQVFSQSVASFPDAPASTGKGGSSTGAESGKSAASAEAKNASLPLSIKLFGRQHGVRLTCSDYEDATRTALSKLTDSLRGVALPQGRFEECMKPVAAAPASNGGSSDAGSGGGKTGAAPAQRTAPTPLSIVSSSTLYIPINNKVQKIIINGGLPSPDLIVVDPHLIIEKQETKADGTTQADLSWAPGTNAKTTARLLVTDFAGEEIIVTVVAEPEDKAGKGDGQ